MAAIITEQFRINSRKRLFDDITNNANNYYIGIGKQDGWAELNPSQTVPTSPFPAGTLGDVAEVRKNISALFKISGSSVSTMLPNYIIQSDRSYKVYNPYDPTCFYASSTEFPCFVISRLDSLGGGTGDHVFLCVGKSHTATFASHSFERLGSPSESTDEPGLYSYSQDGYIWLYMGRYTAANTSVNNGAFVSYDFGQTVTATPHSSGLIHGFHIINGGVSLTNGPSTAVNVEITGLQNGSKTTLSTVPALLKIVNGKITKITLNADIRSGTTYKLWSSATARITTSGYTTTQIVPIIAPIGGYESKLETTLPSWYIGVGADTVNSQFVPSGTSYRQISIIKNPKRNNNNDLNDATVDRVHKSFSTIGNGKPANERLALGGYDVDTGWKIKQGNYLVATISAVELKDNVWSYYYYNSIQAGVFNIDDTQPLTLVAPAELALFPNELALLANQYDLNSSSTLFNTSTGEILFIDNRGAVTREAGQNEEIKIIIQL